MSGMLTSLVEVPIRIVVDIFLFQGVDEVFCQAILDG